MAGETWPVVKGPRRNRAPGSSSRTSLAGLKAARDAPGVGVAQRVHRDGLPGLLDAAHQQLAGPLVLIWDNLNSHVSAAMTELAATRDWLTVCQLPPYAHELKTRAQGKRNRQAHRDPAVRQSRLWAQTCTALGIIPKRTRPSPGTHRTQGPPTR